MKPHHRVFFEVLLRLFPLPFRERFGDGMRDTFEVRYRERVREPRVRRAAFLLRTAADMIRSGLRERLRPALQHEPVRAHAQQSMGWGGMMGNVLQDLRFALRSLRRRPGFAVIAVTTLTLGIGANTAIFSVVNGVMLLPLTYFQPEAIVTIQIAPSEQGGRPVGM